MCILVFMKVYQIMRASKKNDIYIRTLHFIAFRLYNYQYFGIPENSFVYFYYPKTESCINLEI